MPNIEAVTHNSMSSIYERNEYSFAALDILVLEKKHLRTNLRFLLKKQKHLLLYTLL